MLKIRELATQLGILRVMLLLLAIIEIIFTPEPGTTVARSGWEIIPTLVAPAMAPIVFMGLMFDFMMARIGMSSTNEAGKRRYQIISRIDLGMAILMVLLWIPFLVSLNS